LHNRRGNDAKRQRLPEPVGSPSQQGLEEAAGKSPETLREKQHAKQEYGDARRDLLEIGAEPKPESQETEYDWQQYSF
jgi:hypothetical protein